MNKKDKDNNNNDDIDCKDEADNLNPTETKFDNIYVEGTLSTHDLSNIPSKTITTSTIQETKEIITKTKTITITNTRNRTKIEEKIIHVNTGSGNNNNNNNGNMSNSNSDSNPNSNSQPQEKKSSFQAAGDRYRRVNGIKSNNNSNTATKNKNKNKNSRNNSDGNGKYIPPGCEPLWEDADNGLLVPELAHLQSELVESICYEIMDHSPNITWNDIAGLSLQKKQIKEIIIWPLQRPDIFKGLRNPPRGVLLFGPPGTGKTMIAKAIASQVKDCKFFTVSASSLNSKWHGQSEKLVKHLFHIAKFLGPSIVFIDEIDSLLSQRSSNEFDATRRVKTEFLIQLDGINAKDKNTQSNLLLIGATNRPQEIDEAARRRLVRKLYIPLPDAEGRIQLVKNLLKDEKYNLSEDDFNEIVRLTDGYSGADMKALSTEAAFGPLQGVGSIVNVDKNQVRAIDLNDFKRAMSFVKPSVSQKDLKGYVEWNEQFGVSLKQPDNENLNS